MAPRPAGLLMLLLAACASSNAVTLGGQQVRRVDLGYTDRAYFAFAHRRALPGDVYAVGRGIRDGGRIVGVACGLDFIYDVWHLGHSVVLTGFVQPTWTSTGLSESSYIQVRDRGGVREITGSIGNEVGYSTVDLKLTRDTLRGRVSIRRFDLVAEGDVYHGGIQAYGRTGRFIALGREALWSMPPADQAVVIPKLLACARGVGPYPRSPITWVSFVPFEELVAPPPPPPDPPTEWLTPPATPPPSPTPPIPR